MIQEAPVKLDKRTKDLVKRLSADDFALIDHEDMDRVSAESLLATGVQVVINASKSISGNYPNEGPLLLARGGVIIVDNVGKEIFDIVREGDLITIDGNNVFLGKQEVGSGERLSVENIEKAMLDASENIGDRIDEFARNTLQYMEREKALIAERIWTPEVKTQFEGRHVLVVVRGYDYQEDLRTLRPYISEMKPLLIGVDGGADAIMEAGYKPDIIVGDMDSVSDKALVSGAELIVHAYADGRAPGMERLAELHVDDHAFTWPLAATSEDLALILAWENGADLIVALGTHANLVEYLDKGRKGMASSFLVRLRVGPKLMDAKGVNKLYRSSVSPIQLIPLALVAVAVLAVPLLISEPLREQLSLVIMLFRMRLGF